MTPQHVTQEELVRYVLDALEPGQAEELEAHVAVCPRCAAALQAEARVELALQEVLPQVRAQEQAVVPLQRPRTEPTRALPRHAPWLLMTAAAVLVLVFLPHAEPGPRHLLSVEMPGVELAAVQDAEPSSLLSAVSPPAHAEAAEETLLCALAPPASDSGALCPASQGPFCGPMPSGGARP